MGSFRGLLASTCLALLACDGPTPDEGSTAIALTSTATFGCDQTLSNRNTSGSTQSTYACVPGTFGGAEFTATLNITQTGPVTVSLRDFEVYPMVIVLKDVGGGLATATCVTGNYYSARWNAVAGERYYVVVDTPAGAPSLNFDVRSDCQATTTETDCADRFDLDADARFDCNDPDCDNANACRTELCEPWDTLACGDTLQFGSTDGFGSTDQIDEYACFTDGELPQGDERAYAFQPTTSGWVAFTVSNANEYPMLYVLEDDGGGCNPNRCVAHNYYSTRFWAQAGRTYYLVTDSRNAASYSFNVSVVCNAPTTETACNDDVDEDGDTKIDCADSDCATSPDCAAGGRCSSQGTLTCATKLLHGTTSGAGSTDVIGSYACASHVSLGNPERAYTIGPFSSDTDMVVTLSNETGYGLISILEERGTGCDPASCVTENFYSVSFKARRNKTYYAVVEADLSASIEYDISVVCNPPGNESQASCTDKIDNDGDRLIDCADSQCASACSQAGACTAAAALTCASTLVPGSTAAVGARDAVDAYACYPGAATSGPEYTYTFVPPVAGDYVFTLSDENNYAMIAVLDEAPNACDPAACRAFQYYSVVATGLRQGKTYYVVVDGPGPGAVNYKVSAVCNPQANETACGNNVDDDGDFWIDCEDPDCSCSTFAPSDRLARGEPAWIPPPRRAALWEPSVVVDLPIETTTP